MAGKIHHVSVTGRVFVCVYLSLPTLLAGAFSDCTSPSDTGSAADAQDICHLSEKAQGVRASGETQEGHE
jgi:hypothetical protein